jgi:ubiquinone/menaquinone biosynthesis C-methylase UbiE
MVWISLSETVTFTDITTMKKYLINDFDLVKYIDVADELPIWSAPFGLKLLDYINYKVNISVVDIGFGTGFPLTEIALRLGAGSIVYGIDPWKDAIERVNKKVNYYGLTNVRIIEGVAESIPLDNDSIDLITSNNGINNVSDIDKVLTECSRIIKQGGQFIQTMNTDLSMFEFYGQLEQVLSDLHMDKEIDLMRQHISYKRPPIDKMISMIQKHGFMIKDLKHDQFNYKFANGSAMLNHYFIRLAFMDSWIKLLPLDKVEQIFDTVELRLNEQSLIFGGITLSIPYVMINAIKK